MDLDAEMEKLQEEARRQLARKRAEDPDPELPPQKFEALDESLRRLNKTAAAMEEEVEGPGTSLAMKLLILIVALVVFSVLWQSVLAPAVQTVAGLAVLALIVLGVWKLATMGGSKE